MEGGSLVEIGHNLDQVCRSFVTLKIKRSQPAVNRFRVILSSKTPPQTLAFNRSASQVAKCIQ